MPPGAASRVRPVDGKRAPGSRRRAPHASCPHAPLQEQPQPFLYIRGATCDSVRAVRGDFPQNHPARAAPGAPHERHGQHARAPRARSQLQQPSLSQLVHRGTPHGVRRPPARLLPLLTRALPPTVPQGWQGWRKPHEQPSSTPGHTPPPRKGFTAAQPACRPHRPVRPQAPGPSLPGHNVEPRSRDTVPTPRRDHARHTSLAVATMSEREHATCHADTATTSAREVKHSLI